MFCTNCGNDVKDQKFCANCGTRVEQNKENVNEVEEVIQTTSEFDEVQNPVVVVENSNNSSNSNTYNNFEQASNVEYSSKSKVTAGLFGIFLGVFGVHNFYLGYTGKAVAQLLISILSCGILAVVSEIWGLIEGIMILSSKDYKDGQGKILKD